MHTHTGFADVNGTRLYDEMAGSGHPLVLIHGFTLDTRMWDAQIVGNLFLESREMPKQSTGFEQMYPHIARWVTSYGWIEIGDDGQSPSLVRALDEGGLVWEDSDDDTSLDEVLQALDAFLAARMQGYYA
jgi:hypothetical protein